MRAIARYRHVMTVGEVAEQFDLSQEEVQKALRAIKTEKARRHRRGKLRRKTK